MKKIPEHIETLTPELIEAYLNGQLAAQDMHRVERLMLDSDFDSEAVEGYELAGVESIRDISVLQKQLAARTKRKVMPVWMKIAASLLIFFISALLIYNYDFNQVAEVPQIAEAQQDQEVEEQAVEPELEPAPAEKKKPDLTIGIEAENPAAKTAVQDEPSIAVVKNKTDEVNNTASKSPTLSSDNETEAATTAPEILTNQTELADIEIALDDAINEKVMPESKNLTQALRGKAAGVTIRKKTDQRIITGKVYSNEDGTPLPGINVVIKGTNKGTVTDIDGNYELAIEDPDAELVFSFIGLASQEVAIGNRQQLDITMDTDVRQLSEVVVTGYGAERSRDASVPIIIPAKPDGGMGALKDYLQKHLADTTKEKERVVVEFVVQPSQNLTNFRFIKIPADSLEAEIIDLIKKGPRWSPSKKDGVLQPDTVKLRFRY